MSVFYIQTKCFLSIEETDKFHTRYQNTFQNIKRDCLISDYGQCSFCVNFSLLVILHWEMKLTVGIRCVMMMRSLRTVI